MKRFEYHVFTIGADATFFSSGGKVDIEAMDSHINELGGEGWELATALDTTRLRGDTRDVILIFKRERQN